MSVTHNAVRNRYEMPTEHGLAIAEYRQQGDRLIFTHTEVPPEDEGKGLAAKVVHAALEDTHRRGLKIVPACSYVVAYVRRHPEFDDSAR
ncbi:MAG: N-acetyltransferase [Alphaproteobacteria bacterium]|jgi:predicted GNAT family acetyltransferase|nr:N-acetyltransferase [Alphaproteobacteria bacterium]